MQKQALAMLGLACTLTLGTTLYAAKAGQTPQQPDTIQAERQHLQQNIERLEKELADEKSKLASLDRGINVLKAQTQPASQLAIVQNTTGVSAVVNRGKRDGFRLSDRLVFVRRTDSGPILDGIGDIYKLFANDLVAAKSTGVRPEDEAYIINRENSPYSLCRADFWSHTF